MTLFKRLLPNALRQPSSSRPQKNIKNKNFEKNSLNLMTGEDECRIFDRGQPLGDSYLLNAWVNIAVNILIRNIARADFVIKRDGEDVTNGSLFELFRRPNKTLSRFDLWKETAGWWFLEGGGFLVVRPGLLRRFA
jgi:hypothetical protein